MAASNTLELVIEVNPSKANAGIKGINTGLSSMEQAAVRASARTAGGMDGLTASMVKGAAAGNMIAESVRTALGWLKQMTVEVAKYAARTDVLGVVTQQLARVNDISAAKVNLLVDRIKALGITTQEAHGVVQKMIFAELDLGKAADMARVAQDAAVIAGMDSSEALDNMILGITTAQTRLLHNMGLQVSLERTVAEEEKRLGRSLSETEKRLAMQNKVISEGAKIYGTYEAAMEKVGKQMTSLTRYFAEAKNAIGDRFQTEMRAVVYGLRDLAFWLKENAALVTDIARGVAAAAAAGGIVLLTQKVIGLAGALQGLGTVALANPVGLIAAGVVGAGAIIYSEWRRMKQTFEEMDRTYDKWLTGQITGAKTGADLAAATDKVEKAFAAGTIEAKQYAQALDMIEAAKARVYNWGSLGDFSKNLGLNIKIPNPKAEAAAAAALALEIQKQQVANEKAFRDRALEAGKSGLTGFAKDMADIYAEIGKRTLGTDEKGLSYYVALTKKAWNSIIEEARLKLDAFKKHFAAENRKALAEHMKGEEEVAQKRLEWDAHAYQKRLEFETEWHAKAMDHLRDLMAFEEQRAGFARDARLRELEGVDAQTLKQKLWVEGRKADIEVEYLERVHEIKLRLFDAETSMQAMQYELTMRTLNLGADVIEKRLAEYTQMREQIRQQQQETTDAAIDAARENAANRQMQLVREHNRTMFDSLKQQAGGVFDALLTKSQSVWSAIGNAFKIAMLTAIKEVVTSRVAALLMQLFTGTRVSFASAGTGGGMLSGLGGLLGIGAVPVFAGGGGGMFGGGFGVPGMGPGGTPPFIPGGGYGGAGGGIGGVLGGSSSGGGMLSNAGLAGLLPGLKSFLGIGGSIQLGPGMATTWQAATFGQKLSSIGKSNAALMAGTMLAMDGLRRGGFTGLAETTAGGAMIGYKYGGPLGAAIGAGVGAIAGFVRLFVKGAQEKAREKIKALYGVDISDKALLKQIVDTAKQAYGGNLDVALRSQQIRELVQLYAMSTGQRSAGIPAGVTPVSFLESGGSLYRAATYQNGTALPSAGGLSTFDSIGSGGGPIEIHVHNQLPSDQVGAYMEGRVVTTITKFPRASQQAVYGAMKSNAGRRELSALQLSPGLVTA